MLYQETPVIAPIPAGNTYHPLADYKSPAGLMTFLKGALLICILLTFGNLYFAWNEHNYLQSIARNPDYLAGRSVVVDYPVSDLRPAVILAYIVVVIVVGIAFLRWVYRACKNVHAVGGVNLSYTPGWAVGWFFVPIANLVMPYKVLQEIYKASRHPVRWKSVPASGIITAWWLCAIGSNLINRAAVSLNHSSADLEQLVLSQKLSIGGLVMDVVVSGLLFLILTEVTGLQQAVFRYLCDNPDEHPAAAPPAPAVTEVPLRPVPQERELEPLCPKA